mmetsp:Transcript_57580/g.126108  ORF Transcript_57580/g.126108 Transcript_57580/m.126108 type:complete len:346 (-) Transcript_57580:2233-3270(-)
MAIWAIAEGTARNSAKHNAVVLETLARAIIIPPVHQVRGVAEARCAHELRRTLTQQTTQNVEHASKHMRPAGQSSWPPGPQKRSFWNFHIQQRIETIVEHNLGVENHDHVGAAEHLEQLHVQIEVDGRRRLRVSLRKIENRVVLTIGLHNLLQGARDLERPIALAIVTDVVFEVQLLLRHLRLDDLMHGILVSQEHQIQGSQVSFSTEPPAELLDPDLSQLDRGHDGLQITSVPIRLAHIVENELLETLVEHSLAVQLDRGNGQTFLKNLCGIVRHTASNHTAHIRHVAKHRSPSDVRPLVIDRAQDKPVIQMADRTVASIRVAHHNHVTVFNWLVVPTQECRDK